MEARKPYDAFKKKCGVGGVGAVGAGGAAATADRQWRVAASFQGFDSKHHALQFEDVFKSNPSYGLHERLKLSEDLCYQAKYNDASMC